ncbi:MAG: SRPBCC domain-containing protein [Acidimicrobiia bacterium]|nr:SRPBCC domain-containing protein [Acidimicrobiia bacterium]
MRLSTTPIEPIRKTRHVALDKAGAFELFTDRIGSWWPLATHSIADDHAVGVRFEGAVGGRVVELTDSGEEHSWADVIAWDPPHRFALAWHPIENPTAATIVDVRFHEAEGGTDVELEHRGWEELGPEDGQMWRDSYDPGWDAVLERFVGCAAAV